MLKGIDVSYHQGKIDWAKVKADGIDFAIIRAGYGLAVDARFVENIKAAKAAGIKVGVYWFCYALSTGKAMEEANFCHKTIKAYGIDLPVYYDFEYDTERYASEHGVTYSASLRTAIIDAFCKRIMALGYEAGVYVNADYIKYKLNWNTLKKYPLWLAQWGTKDGVVPSFDAVSPNAVNKTYGTPVIWQFGSTPVNGIKNPVDSNYGYFKVSEPVKVAGPIKAGDTVKVINTTRVNNKTRGKTYSNGTFVVWYDKYTVMSIKGDRVVIGVNGITTAAVHVSNLEKIA